MLSKYISSQISAHFPFNPTSDQSVLIDVLGEYVANGTSRDILIINGYAGTGKSSVIAALAAMLKSNNIKYYMLAPTGRAAKVMSSYAGEGAVTIHKKIYRQKSISEEKFVLDFNRDKGSYYIIDEASMIGGGSYEYTPFGSGNLLSDLMEYINLGTDCKVIIVGDSAQLPPIGTNLSPALDVNYMSQYGNIIYQSMNEVVRQALESGILTNATICRKIIESGTPSIPKFNLNFPDVKNITGGEFLEELEDAYAKYGRDRCIVITRSNKQAGRFNQGIRGRVLYQEEELSSGDLVMIVKNNYAYAKEKMQSNGRSEIDDTDFIANGDVALIRRVRKYEEVHSLRFAESTIWLGSDNERELECKVILNTLGSDSPALSKEDSTKLLKSVEEDYLSITRKNERYKEMKKDPYLNALQIKFAYAITCHKSQGGEWDAVFIDRMLFGNEEMSIDLLRWLYTAMTRASKRLFFINFEERFFED